MALLRMAVPKSGRSGREGLTLLEVVFATAILAVAIVGLVSSLLSSMQLRRMNAEKALARNAAEEVLSAVRGMGTIVDAYARFGGGGPQETFDVPGLASAAAGVPVGTVIVWRNKNGSPPDPASANPPTGADLTEAQARLGLPFPLALVGTEGPNSSDFLDTPDLVTGLPNGIVDSNDHPSLMPVTVRIRWRFRGGAVMTEYFSTVIGKR
jgi:hypothetical protein